MPLLRSTAAKCSIWKEDIMEAENGKAVSERKVFTYQEKE